MTQLRLYCACGARWKLDVPDEKAEGIRQIWESAHTGDGHAPVDAKTAYRAYRNAEDAWAGKTLRTSESGEGA